MSRPRGRPLKHDLGPALDDGLDGMCPWCHKFKKNSRHESCMAEKLRRNPWGYFCENPRCTFATDHVLILRQHAEKSPLCRQYYGGARLQGRFNAESHRRFFSATTNPLLWIPRESNKGPGVSASNSQAQSFISQLSHVTQKSVNKHFETPRNHEDLEDLGESEDAGSALLQMEEGMACIAVESMEDLLAHDKDQVLDFALDGIGGDLKLDIVGFQNLREYIRSELSNIDRNFSEQYDSLLVLSEGAVDSVLSLASSGGSMIETWRQEKRNFSRLAQAIERVREKEMISTVGAKEVLKETRPVHPSTTRRKLRDAGKHCSGHVWRAWADTEEFDQSKLGHCRYFCIAFRDPVLCCADVLKMDSTIAEGESFKTAFERSQDGVIRHPQHGQRFQEMQDGVRHAITRHRLERNQPENAEPHPDDIEALPIVLYLDDTRTGNSQDRQECPIVVKPICMETAGFRRESVSRTIGFFKKPIIHKTGSSARAKAYFRSLRKFAFRMIMEVISAWQLVAINEGGIRITDSTSASKRYVPVLSHIVGDTKELDVLSGTILSFQRCRICAQIRLSRGKNGSDPMPLQKSKSAQGVIRALNKARQARNDNSRFKAARDEFKDATGMECWEIEHFPILDTTLKFFTEKPFDLFPFDSLHTFHLGKFKEAFAYVRAGIGLNRFYSPRHLADQVAENEHHLEDLNENQNPEEDVRVKLAGDLKNRMKADTVKNVVRRQSRCEKFLQDLGLGRRALLRRHKAKEYLSLCQGLIVAFLHDIFTESNPHHVLGLRHRLYPLIWNVAADVKIAFSLKRSSIPCSALPHIRADLQNSDQIMRFVRRELLDMRNEKPLKAHGLYHLLESIKQFGPPQMTDTDHFERHHVSVKKAALNVNNHDGTGLDLVNRCIEDDVGRMIVPRAIPRRYDRAVAVGKSNQATRRSLNRNELVQVLADLCRMNGFCDANLISCQVVRRKLSALPDEETDVHQKMETKFKQITCASRRHTPTLCLTQARLLILPLAVLTQHRHLDKPILFGLALVQDIAFHEKLAQLTFDGRPLDGFEIIDLAHQYHQDGNALQLLRPAELCRCETYKLFPWNDEDHHYVVWPDGNMAFDTWLKYPIGPVSRPLALGTSSRSRAFEMRSEARRRDPHQKEPQIFPSSSSSAKTVNRSSRGKKSKGDALPTSNKHPTRKEDVREAARKRAIHHMKTRSSNKSRKFHQYK